MSPLKDDNSFLLKITLSKFSNVDTFILLHSVSESLLCIIDNNLFDGFITIFGLRIM